MSAWERRRIWILCSLVCCFGLSAYSSAAWALEYSTVDRATVRVFSFNGVALERRENEGRKIPVAVPDAAHGSGVLVSGDGLILTAKHVVEGARLLAVQLQGAQGAVPARLVHADSEHDLAWLAIEGTYGNYIEIVEPTEELAVRSNIFVIGYPLDATRSDPQSQSGVISGMLPDGSLQLGVALNPGNSGGPVITASGQLVGIAVRGADPRKGAQGIGVAVPIEHILVSASRVREQQLLQQAQTKLARDRARDQVRAGILSAMMTSDGVVEGLRIDENADTKAGEAFWNSLKRAVQVLGAESPELILLAATRHFNNAVWRQQAGTGAWRSAMGTARQLVVRAVGYDSSLKQNEFARLVLKTKSGNSAAQPVSYSTGSPMADSGESFDSDEDDMLLGDVSVKRKLPTFGMGPTLMAGYNTVLFGGGLAGWLYFERAFHLYYRYMYGVTLTSGGNGQGAHYAEVYAGFPITTSHGYATVKLIVDVDYQPGVTVYSYTNKTLPTYSLWTIEAGTFISPIGYYFCDATCATDGYFLGEGQAAEISTLAAGIRYRYFYYAGGHSLRINARQHVDVSLHALAAAFGMPEGNDLYNALTDEPMKTASAGVRFSAAGILMPWVSTPMDISVGFLPANSTFFASLGASFYLH